MDLEKLKKYAKEESPEKLFGISPSSDNAYSIFVNYASNVGNYDDDSVSDMVSHLDDAVDNLEEASQECENLENCLTEWRDLALYMWENMDKDMQQDYISYWAMTEERKQAVHKAFKLEDLKKL